MKQGTNLYCSIDRQAVLTGRYANLATPITHVSITNNAVIEATSNNLKQL